VRPIDQFFIEKDEPVKSCLQFLRSHLIAFHPHITEEWKYSLPFYYYNGKPFCYLWIHKKYKQPYIGIVEGGRLEHPSLLKEKRARMKILLVDPTKDVSVRIINTILKQALKLY
jgi:hypothetical protein